MRTSVTFISSLDSVRTDSPVLIKGTNIAYTKTPNTVVHIGAADIEPV